MNTIESEVSIAAPLEQVWSVVSDLTAMRAYMPGIDTVTLSSEVATGVGAGRHCVFADGVELSERVTHWDEGRGYTLETTAFKGVPMRSNVITFLLFEAEGSTVVKQSMRYEMKGGLMAPLMERMAKPMMRKALRGALDGLKAHVE